MKPRLAAAATTVIVAIMAAWMMWPRPTVDGVTDYFRADALESIYRLEKREGLDLASQNRSRSDFLGTIAEGLIDGSHKPFERSYLRAGAGHHE